MSVWAWYGWLMTWKFATQQVKTQGEVDDPPLMRNPLKPSRQPVWCLQEEEAVTPLRLPERLLLLLLDVCPREHQPLPQHNIPSLLEACWFSFSLHINMLPKIKLKDLKKNQNIIFLPINVHPRHTAAVSTFPVPPSSSLWQRGCVTASVRNGSCQSYTRM